jgi:hypothetical protein
LKIYAIINTDIFGKAFWSRGNLIVPSLFLCYNGIDKLEETENGRQFSVGANEKEISLAIDSIVSFLGRCHVHVRTWTFFMQQFMQQNFKYSVVLHLFIK